MKKRFLAVVLVVALTLSLLAACTSKAGNSGGSGTTGNSSSESEKKTDNAAKSDEKPSPSTDSPSPSQNSPSSDSGREAAKEKNKTPSESYTAYIEAKSKAYERISDIADDHDELLFTVSFAMLPVVMVDLSLLALTVVGLEESAYSALSILGMSNIDVKQNGSVYTITYTGEDGEKMTQTCEYDAATDSMRSVISVEGVDAMTFEYANSGHGYASQYFSYDEDSGEHSLIKVYCDDNSAGIGIESAGVAPKSIFKNTGLKMDFVKNGELYFTV